MSLDFENIRKLVLCFVNFKQIYFLDDKKDKINRKLFELYLLL